MINTRSEEHVSLHTSKPEETLKLAASIGKVLQEGDCIALHGPLGSGKTLFAQGIAKGLDVSGEFYITSPTFTIINEYPGRFTLYHLDLYRIGEEDELSELGLEEIFSGKGIVVIEWPEKLTRDFLIECNVKIELIIAGWEERKIIITSSSKSVLYAAQSLFPSPC